MNDGPATALLLVLIIFGVLVVASIGLYAGRRRGAAPPREAEAPAPPEGAGEAEQASDTSVIEAPPAEAPPDEAIQVEAPPVEAPQAEPAVVDSSSVDAPAVESPSVDAPSVPTPVEAPPFGEVKPKRGRVRSIGSSVRGVFKRSTLTDEDWEELEEILLRADVGVASTDRIVTALRKQRGVTDGVEALRTELLDVLGTPDRTLKRKDAGLTVWLITGVNGAGKTTTIGKLAAQLRAGGASVVLAAADTFRAAADEQLDRWGQAAGARVVRGPAGGDPASVVFDGVAAARAESADVLIVDTAGRLQTKRNLMEELGKIKRVLEREAGEPDEVLLVLDATTGQNGVQQARAFAEVAGVTGIALTKLDGSARGGIVIAVQQDLGIPVKLVGSGEGIDDLAPFDPASFVDDLIAP